MAGMNEGSALRPLGEFNLVATFTDIASAKRAAGQLRLRGLGEESITVAPASQTPEVDEARMRDELEGVVAGPGLVATKSMTVGAAVGSVIGLFAGAVLGWIVGVAAFHHGTGSHAVGLWASVIVVAVALGVAGAVAGGFLKPRYRPEVGDSPQDFEGTPEHALPTREARDAQMVVAVRVDDPQDFALSEEVLEQASPVRLDRLGRRGEVIGTEEVGRDSPPVQPGSARQIVDAPAPPY